MYCLLGQCTLQDQALGRVLAADKQQVAWQLIRVQAAVRLLVLGMLHTGCHDKARRHNKAISKLGRHFCVLSLVFVLHNLYSW